MSVNLFIVVVVLCFVLFCFVLFFFHFLGLEVLQAQVNDVKEFYFLILFPFCSLKGA